MGLKESKKEYGEIYREKYKKRIKRDKKIYYKKNRDKIIESVKKYRINNKDKVKEIHRIDYEKNKEHYKEIIMKWRKNNIEKVKEMRKRNTIKYRERYPEKIKAINKSQKIKIPLNQICQECEKKLAKHKHHPNYKKPMKIVFLCVKCHNHIHNNKRNRRDSKLS